MLKNIFVAASVLGLLVATVSLQAAPAEARSGCGKAAKEHAQGWKARHEYKKMCKAQYKMHKETTKTGGLFKGGLFKKKDAAA